VKDIIEVNIERLLYPGVKGLGSVKGTGSCVISRVRENTLNLMRVVDYCV